MTIIGQGIVRLREFLKEREQPQPAPQSAHAGHCRVMWDATKQITTIESDESRLEHFLREVATREHFTIENLTGGTISVTGGHKDMWSTVWPRALIHLVEYTSVPSPSNVVETAKMTRDQLEARPSQVPVVPEQITKPRRIANPFSTEDMQGFSPGYEDKRKK